jgi:hypothetical protein
MSGFRGNLSNLPPSCGRLPGEEDEELVEREEVAFVLYNPSSQRYYNYSSGGVVEARFIHTAKLFTNRETAERTQKGMGRDFRVLREVRMIIHDHS